VAKFVGRPLKVLDLIYDFVGGWGGLGEFAEESAIQPVHDVARQAELGAALGGLGQFGFTMIRASHVHVGAGTIRTTADPYNAFSNLSVPRDQGSIWIMDVFGTSNAAADFKNAGCLVTWPIFSGFSNADVQPLAFFNTALGDVLANLLLLGRAEGAHQLSKFPLFVPDDSIISFGSEADGAGTVTITQTVLTWAGPAGARPPGVA